MIMIMIMIIMIMIMIMIIMIIIIIIIIIHRKITMAGDVVPYYTVTAVVPTLK